MNKLRLFAIRKETEQDYIESVFFSDMIVAKKIRDDYTRATNEPHVVTWGPDHRKYRDAKQRALKEKEPA